MMLIEEAPVPTEVLPVAELKAHLRLGSGFADDGVQDEVLESFLRAALSAIETRIGKALLSRDFAFTLHGWGSAPGQALPIAPVTAILAAVSVDRNGNETAIAPETFRLVTDHHRPVLATGSAPWPKIPSGGSIRLRFTAGYGSGWGDVPPDLKQAVLMLAAHYYEHRNETTLGSGCMPFGVTSLIERYRPLRMSFGAGA